MSEPFPERLSREAIRARQTERVQKLLAEILERNPFYRERYAGWNVDPKSIQSPEDLRQLPLLTKQELVDSQNAFPPFGRNLTYPLTDCARLHQTSGTTGKPMRWLDTRASWDWFMDCWAQIYRLVGIRQEDIFAFPFSFGPFIGFWTASDALVRCGALVIPGGGMSSETRLQMIVDHRCTVVCCTPTYALHLITVAEKQSIDLRSTSVTRLIVAGEPGGSSAEIRSRIQDGWGATVIDHSGASEIGAWGFGSEDGTGLHVIETEFIAERLCFDDANPNGRRADDGEQAELVLTGLGRFGGPAIRYRTGDIVRGYEQHEHPCRFLFLDGGVLGRSDDMMVIRGVNVFPSSIESIIRQLDATAEFRMIVTKQGEMDTLAIETEMDAHQCDKLAKLFQRRLAMRVGVTAVPIGSLPRFEAKAKRLVDQRGR
ncbi:MAG: phenylacetate--CoA ligase family protein [Planctomycetaceae bacterium]|nr:phenylacetate--CoA ligase family protein [Planctomycetaceae bacterium]